MLEITSDDIAALNDEDLRTLVGRLCEAELRARNLATSAATWGGDQDAKDGGVDVRVGLEPGTAIHGFIPKPHTGFQVKKSDMPRAAIIEEMRPKGGRVDDLERISRAIGAKQFWREGWIAARQTRIYDGKGLSDTRFARACRCSAPEERPLRE